MLLTRLHAWLGWAGLGWAGLGLAGLGWGDQEKQRRDLEERLRHDAERLAEVQRKQQAEVGYEVLHMLGKAACVVMHRAMINQPKRLPRAWL